jgi:hypothetical protein
MKKSIGYCVHVMAAGLDGYVATTLQMMLVMKVQTEFTDII